MAYLLAAVSIAAFIYAARLALGMAAERRAMRDRIARAINRPGEN